jgi:ribosomal 50S subunit-recycling heat shock protein
VTRRKYFLLSASRFSPEFLFPPFSTMRLDIFLKLSRLEPRRTLAQEMCEAGAVRVNGLQAKSGHKVRDGDLISIQGRSRIATVRVVKIPTKPPSRRDAESLYETVSIDPIEA